MEHINALIDWVRSNLDLLTLVLLLFTNMLMISQNRIAKKASDSQNMIDVIKYIQENETRESRKHVFVNLRGRPMKEWSAKDMNHAQRVLMSYDIAGRLMQEKYVDPELILNGWGLSIKQSYQILHEYIDGMSKNDSTYWSGLDWLYKQVKKWERRHNVVRDSRWLHDEINKWDKKPKRQIHNK
jgi:hypothetical protein